MLVENPDNIQSPQPQPGGMWTVQTITKTNFAFRPAEAAVFMSHTLLYIHWAPSGATSYN